VNDLFKKRNELARKLASMTPDEVLKMRTGYAGKSQQWQYGFDLACREKQAEIDALKAQNERLQFQAGVVDALNDLAYCNGYDHGKKEMSAAYRKDADESIDRQRRNALAAIAKARGESV